MKVGCSFRVIVHRLVLRMSACLRRILQWSPVLGLACAVASCTSTPAPTTQVVDGVAGYIAKPRPTKCRRPSPTPYPVQATRILEPLSFEEPTNFLPSPLANQWIVVERKGRVFRAEPGAAGATSHVMIDLSDRIVSTQGEDGVLGLALSPDFSTTGEVFISYTSPIDADRFLSRVSRFFSRDGGLTIDPTSEEIIYEALQTFPGHNGGRIGFGPDRFLYLALGDGWWGDPLKRAQNLNEPFGKLLRFDVLSPNRPYAIPSDNPFANGGGLPEIYAYGLRNPWGFSFDETGKLWLADVGHERWEEIDIIVNGGNYGWSEREGTHCTVAEPCDVPGAIDPIFEYPHVDGFSISGGHVYRGEAIPSLKGKYIFGDFISGRMWSLEGTTEGKYAEREILDSPFGLVAFAEGADHEFYLIDFFQGGIYRLDPTEPSVEEPASLASLGCLDPASPGAMDEGLIPYDVNSPLWSDGLSKNRWLAIPEGSTIHVAEDGDWDLPSGSIVLKTFEHEGKKIETRMLTRDGDRWFGYAFEWNEAQSDATLLTTGKARDLGGQSWQIPSRAQCLSCHTAAAGRTLGLETAQLNRAIVYPSQIRANQLTTLASIGVLDAALDPAHAPQFASPSSDAPLADRARAYLHSNCSHCHRPLGPGGGSFDLRATTPQIEAHLLCAKSTWGSSDTVSAVVVAPGQPDNSSLFARMDRRGSGQMPPLGSSTIDGFGVELVREWISALGSCDEAH